VRKHYVYDEQNPEAEREYGTEMEDYAALGYSNLIDFPEVDDILISMTPEEFESFIAQIKDED
jgi:hypothetical protein